MNGNKLLDFMDLIDIELVEESEYPENCLHNDESNHKDGKNTAVWISVASTAAAIAICLVVNQFTNLKPDNPDHEIYNEIVHNVTRTESHTEVPYETSDKSSLSTDGKSFLNNTTSSEIIVTTGESVTKVPVNSTLPVIAANTDSSTQSKITTAENTPFCSVSSDSDIGTVITEPATTSQSDIITDSPVEKYKIIKDEYGNTFQAMSLADKYYIGEKYETENIWTDNEECEIIADVYFLECADFSFARIVSLDDNFIVYRNTNYTGSVFESAEPFENFISSTGIHNSTAVEISYNGCIYSDENLLRKINDLIFESYQKSEQIIHDDNIKPDGYILYELKYAPGYQFRIYLYDDQKITVSFNEQSYSYKVKNISQITAYLKAAEQK